MMWIAGDWGTSSLRLMLMNGDDLVEEIKTSQGVKTIVNPKEIFFTLTATWLKNHDINLVILCGMIGSNIGWYEVNYVDTPCSLPEISNKIFNFQEHAISFYLIPGVHCEIQFGHELMRGEETQLLGAISLVAEDENFCLPGTHSKWVQIKKGYIEQFYTAFTGELYELLSQHSILISHATQSWDKESFLAGADKVLQTEIDINFLLFQIRSLQLYQEISPHHAKCFLSGMLIGLEVKQGISLINTEKRLILIGENELSYFYQLIVKHMNLNCYKLGSSESVLMGLKQIKAILCS